MPRLSVDSLARALWALVLVSLPVTSFRFFPLVGDGTYVRPLALYPLLLLWPLLLIRLKRRQVQRPWPGALTVLLAFGVFTLAVTGLGGLFAQIPLHGADYWGRALRALVTVAAGLVFFLAAIWMNQTEDDLRFSVKWLLVGLAAHLIWGAVQFVGLNHGYRKPLVRIQELFSVRGLVKNKRISGFAYEPSWLAGQIATLYMPWLFAAVLTRFHLTRFKWLEALLLAGGLVGVLMTYSRSGLLVIAVAAFVTLLLAGREPLGALWDWIRAGFERGRWTSRGAAIRAAGGRIALAVLALAVIAGAGLFLTDKGYIDAFFTSQQQGLWSYAVDVYLGPRLAYAVAALRAFQVAPFTGVGLGASGFYIYKFMPDWVLSGVPEIARQLSPGAHLYPNPKDLFVRLLAETGLPGLMLFMAFYLTLFADALALLRHSSRTARWLGAAALFGLVAVLMQGVSQDSFAMPEMWLNLGILAGVAALWTKRASAKEPS